MLIGLHRRALLKTALPYTCGMWQDTKSVTVTLSEGRNSLDVACDVPSEGLAIESVTDPGQSVAVAVCLVAFTPTGETSCLVGEDGLSRAH